MTELVDGLHELYFIILEYNVVMDTKIESVTYDDAGRQKKFERMLANERSQKTVGYLEDVVRAMNEEPKPDYDFLDFVEAIPLSILSHREGKMIETSRPFLYTPVPADNKNKDTKDRMYSFFLSGELRDVFLDKLAEFVNTDENKFPQQKKID